MMLLSGDCLKEMEKMPTHCVDIVLADLPYGITACKWDSVIPLPEFWDAVKRVLKPGGAVILTASQPFTSVLVMSNPRWFRCALVWHKNCATGYLNANRYPLRAHEDVLVFCDRAPVYHPQKTAGTPYNTRSGSGSTRIYGKHERVSSGYSDRFPTSVLDIPTVHGRERGFHPTQKPVALMAYLIRTFSNPGDVVLDPTMGSGTTGIAAIQEGRDFIGIELDPEFYGIACARIAEATGGESA